MQRSEDSIREKKKESRCSFLSSYTAGSQQFEIFKNYSFLPDISLSMAEIMLLSVGDWPTALLTE